MLTGGSNRWRAFVSLSEDQSMSHSVTPLTPPKKNMLRFPSILEQEPALAFRCSGVLTVPRQFVAATSVAAGSVAFTDPTIRRCRICHHT
jgi:hypothetical protein